MNNIPVKKIVIGLLIFQAVSTLTWAVLIFPSILWWKASIEWVVLMSAWANFASHGSGLVAALLAFYEYTRDNESSK